MRLVDKWTLIIIISNILHLIAMAVEIFPALMPDFKGRDYIFGIGTFLIWISLMKYL